MRSIILAIDVGRSKIGCTGYEYNGLGPVITVNGISHNIPLLAVIANTGNIRIHEVLTAIENCIDETLRLLRLHMSESSYQVVAIGFATSVMNLVAVDIYGEPVGEIATCSDACDREDVVTECQRLIDHIGPEKLNALHQRTGAPIHASYSLPQLRAFYGNENNKSIAKQIEKWQTISSICLFRWSGRPFVQMPISFSEASWTGMLDLHTGCWDDEAVDLFETCNGIVQFQYEVEDDDEEYVEGIDLLPPTVDFDAALPFLRHSIPRNNGDGSANSYWERWPELRSFPVQLFVGVGDRGSVADGGGFIVGSARPQLNVQTTDISPVKGYTMHETPRCVSPHEQVDGNNGDHHSIVLLMAASLQQAALRKSAEIL